MIISSHVLAFLVNFLSGNIHANAKSRFISNCWALAGNAFAKSVKFADGRSGLFARRFENKMRPVQGLKRPLRPRHLNPDVKKSDSLPSDNIHWAGLADRRGSTRRSGFLPGGVSFFDTSGGALQTLGRRSKRPDQGSGDGDRA
jgi:hypothetical protein